jgi:tetraacyldisaccharide 4'-kinase
MSFFKGLAAGLYWCVVRLRGWLYDTGLLSSYRSRLSVISVGNVTAGGNGKTPLCLKIAAEMIKRGYRPAILSRGYGGSLTGPHRVRIDDSPSVVGDEPLLMAQAGVPVFIARKRVSGAKVIEDLGEFDLVILDDGFQHRALARDLDIVSVFSGSRDAVKQFKAGRLLPLGMFREPRGYALRRADLIILNDRRVLRDSGADSALSAEIKGALPPSVEVFRSHLSAGRVEMAKDGRPLDPRSVVAFAAIANPEGFFSSLEGLGFELIERVVFNDHYQFTPEDISRISRSFPNHTAVCTAKDMVKLRALPGVDLERIAFLPVSAEIEPSDRFFSLVEERLKGKVRR